MVHPSRIHAHVQQYNNEEVCFVSVMSHDASKNAEVDICEDPDFAAKIVFCFPCMMSHCMEERTKIRETAVAVTNQNLFMLHCPPTGSIRQTDCIPLDRIVDVHLDEAGRGWPSHAKQVRIDTNIIVKKTHATEESRFSVNEPRVVCIPAQDTEGLHGLLRQMLDNKKAAAPLNNVVAPPSYAEVVQHTPATVPTEGPKRVFVAKKGSSEYHVIRIESQEWNVFLKNVEGVVGYPVSRITLQHVDAPITAVSQLDANDKLSVT